jgi:hypothetical protein
MKLAPIGAFGAMAFTIGKYGIGSLLPLLKLIRHVLSDLHPVHRGGRARCDRALRWLQRSGASCATIK